MEKLLSQLKIKVTIYSLNVELLISGMYVGWEPVSGTFRSFEFGEYMYVSVSLT